MVLFTRSLPCVAALLRLFRSEGERALAERMSQELAQRPRQKRFCPLADPIQSSEQQVLVDRE